MKYSIGTIAGTTLLALLLLPAQAQSQGMGGADVKRTDTKGEQKESSPAHTASGTITKVNPENGSVTIAHGPVGTLKWPAMSMAFKVKDKAMLDKLKQGQKVEFDFVQADRDYVITAMR